MNANRQQASKQPKSQEDTKASCTKRQLKLSADWWRDCQKYAQCSYSASAARFAVSPLIVSFFLYHRTLARGAFQIPQAPAFHNLVCSPSLRKTPSFGLRFSFQLFPLSVSSFSNQSNQTTEYVQELHRYSCTHG